MTARNAQREAEVLTALNKVGPCNAACLATAAGYRPAYVVRSLHALAKAGDVTFEVGKHGCLWRCARAA